MDSSRRNLLRGGLLAAFVPAGVALDARPSAAAPPLPHDPFTLGVASGDPAPDGFVIWARLAPDPLVDDGLGGMPASRYRVEWQVASDPTFADVVRRGSAAARPELAHAVHVEVDGLRPGREYYYRFRVGTWLSPVGRALTAPAPGARVEQLTMAFASCSSYQHGYFTAYRHLADERPDLVLHLGDYHYEGPANNGERSHLGGETVTLADYRRRYAQYKTDLDLQAAHQAAPWLAVWDDHEVDNNYADEISEKPAEQATFRQRRADAYQAYYENMPLRRRSVPRGIDLQLYRRVAWGQLATFHMLDTRQYRDDQACGDGYQNCPDADAPGRSLPGWQQERWLLEGFRDSRATWDVLGQQVFFGRRDASADPDVDRVSMDAWDGYGASRRRLVEGMLATRVRNPVVVTGDVHAHWASEVYRDQAEPDSGIVASEFVTSSITSGGDGYDKADGQHPWAAQNPNLRFWTNLRGYVSTRITPTEMAVDYRCVNQVSAPGSPVFTRTSFVLEDRVRGMQKTADDPLLSARTAAPSDRQIIADTLREEVGAASG
ncbi:alkaline phosphatase D family protein [Nocardioides coralli]|uniref:alkaline phosphatase D family protein n=1 Tax=Nocardioides coralli TaxID=2872154 RepID=UPI001CA39303|nr:alkaline phosphatase D family protein [Nocardioides coralli]QZY28231.1 alkaline phosphatase D family protein [Nocardioides coralli]